MEANHSSTPNRRDVQADGQASPPLDRNVQAQADRMIAELGAGLAPEEAAYAAAVLANRAAAELHRLAKTQATATKGTPTWGSWAALQNSARKIVLDASTARDGAAKLTGRQR
ncbi:MAG: hypothetical protein IT305_03530 [Chloroflexi bacterium]|nr:hypothetical protein [Chloroflexota bacterium]